MNVVEETRQQGARANAHGPSINTVQSRETLSAASKYRLVKGGEKDGKLETTPKGEILRVEMVVAEKSAVFEGREIFRLGPLEPIDALLPVPSIVGTHSRNVAGLNSSIFYGHWELLVDSGRLWALLRP